MTNASSPQLFTPVQVGALQLRNRVVTSPMTRTRAKSGHVAGAHGYTDYPEAAPAEAVA